MCDVNYIFRRPYCANFIFLCIPPRLTSVRAGCVGCAHVLVRMCGLYIVNYFMFLHETSRQEFCFRWLPIHPSPLFTAFGVGMLRQHNSIIFIPMLWCICCLVSAVVVSCCALMRGQTNAAVADCWLLLGGALNKANVLTAACARQPPYVRSGTRRKVSC